MHISVDLDKLRQHQEYIQQEIVLADRIINALNLQLCQSMDVSGIMDDILNQQIKFANDLAERLRQRKQLLAETYELLAMAKIHMTSNTSEALHQLESEF